MTTENMANRKDESKPREQNPWYRELLEGGRAEKGPAQ